MKELILPNPSASNQKPTTNNQKHVKGTWYVYILECQDGSFYTGTTNDIGKRIKAHANGTGSKYVKHKRFKKLLAIKQCKNRSDACKAECEIRKLSKWEKLDWFNS